MAGDLLDRILGEIRARKREARAAYEEAQQLGRALAALDAGASRGATQPRSKGTRAAGRGAKERAGERAGERARRGANREAILAAVRERPGSTAREIADATGIARATVASTVTRLAASGVLEREAAPRGAVGFRAA